MSSNIFVKADELPGENNLDMFLNANQAAHRRRLSNSVIKAMGLLTVLLAKEDPGDQYCVVTGQRGNCETCDKPVCIFPESAKCSCHDEHRCTVIKAGTA